MSPPPAPLVRRLACVLLLAVSGVTVAGAQSGDPLAETARTARTAIDARDWEAAIGRLQLIVDTNPAYVSAALEGSAAYWLGLAYEAASYGEQAHDAWRTGLLALDARGFFDARLANAFVWDTYTHGWHADYTLAGQVYLRLLEGLGAMPVADASALLGPHLRALRVVLPEALQDELGLAAWEGGPVVGLTGNAGQRLSAWWRGRDASPSTRANERLEEHLERAAYARANYGLDTGQDARAAVYVRLGPPERTTQVQFDRTTFRNKVIDRSLTLNMSEFYPNEFWYYEHVGPDVQFLFFDRSGYYELGTVRDLLPAAIRTGMGPSPRGRQKAQATVRTLEEIYRQLSIHHNDYAARYQDVAAFVSLLDQSEAISSAQASMAQPQAEINASAGERQRRLAASQQSNPIGGMTASLGGTQYDPARPDLFAQEMIQQGVTEDEAILRRRAENTPAAYTNEFDDAEPLEAMVRYARFLDADGTTRTELYWGVAPGALMPSRGTRRALRRDGVATDDYLLVTTLAQRSTGFRDRALHRHRHVVPDLDADPDASIAPTTYVLEGDTGRYHLALQWEQFAATLDPSGTPRDLGPRVKVNAMLLDSLQALDASGRTLEMSDLKPYVVDPSVALTDGAILDEATVYPAASIRTDQTLLLYFEVYHLAYGADEEARYTVEYEVVRQQDAGFLDRMRDRDPTVLTSAATDYTAPAREAAEYVVLDMADFSGAEAVTITVRVLDQTTGQAASRRIEFDLR